MKTLIGILTIAAVLSFGTQRVSGGDREWATAGKILTGLVIGGVVAKALEPTPVYTAPTVVYTAPAPVVATPAPAAVVYAPAPPPPPPPAPVVYVPSAPVMVYQPAPVYYVRPVPVYHYAPPPVVGFHFSFGARPHHYHHRVPIHRVCR